MTAPSFELPSPNPASAPMDLIFIEGFRGQTVIGIHDSELHHPQPLCIDLHAGLPRAHACRSDRIADTIDYGVVRERLVGLMQHHGVQLLEALAERIATMLLVDFGAAWVRVRIIKPRKFDDVEAVGVMIERRRSEADERGPAGAVGGAQILQWMGAGTVPGERT
ncbi:dihydroneopterin aldolase [Sphaerotilus hippei]|nr:dihydroneopterin aldolase [Sphaerotilus hippei]